MMKMILRLPEVKKVTGLGRSTIYSNVAQGTFPKPIALGPRAVGWPECEVDTIVSARIAGQPDEEIRRLVAQLEAARKKSV